MHIQPAATTIPPRPEIDKLRKELLRRIVVNEQRRKHQHGTHAK
ncbi:MAG TPA: hypothetical protein VHV77_17515 [Pirellulales bacterium]|jgi:hypothetical protein|nr:hypothetical protein [Pirellulales bacterium]